MRGNQKDWSSCYNVGNDFKYKTRPKPVPRMRGILHLSNDISPRTEELDFRQLIGLRGPWP